MISSQPEIQTSNRRKKLTKVYASKEWELASDEFLGKRRITIKGIIRGEGLQVGEAGYLVWETRYWLEQKRPCEWCGEKVGTLAHHPYLTSYNDGTYTDLYLSGCRVLCNRCHFSLHKGLVLCSRCKSRYHIIGADVCKICFNELHPEIVALKEKKKADAKALKKMLREDAKAKAKKWKEEHPIRRPKPVAKSQIQLLSSK